MLEGIGSEYLHMTIIDAREGFTEGIDGGITVDLIFCQRIPCLL